MPGVVSFLPNFARDGLPGETLLLIDIINADGLIIIQRVWATTPDRRRGHRLTRRFDRRHRQIHLFGAVAFSIIAEGLIGLLTEVPGPQVLQLLLRDPYGKMIGPMLLICH